MKLIKRLLILAIAAWLGAMVYGRFIAAQNVWTSVQASSSDSAESKPAFLGKQPSKRKFSGGIGPVGNPYDPKN